MCFRFFYTVQVDTKSSKSSLQLMVDFILTSWNSENKRTYSAQVRLHYVLLKKIIPV